MRCSNCDMPLSPTRTHCPRCNTAVSEQAIARTKMEEGTPYPSLSTTTDPNRALGNNDASQYAEALPPSFGGDAPLSFLSTESTQSTFWNSQNEMSTRENWYAEEHRENAGSFSHKVLEKTSIFTPRLGFSIAGTCITVGTILLILVFMIARTLPKPNATQADQSSIHATGSMPVFPASKPTISLSPNTTETFAGQKYFDNVQIGSEINNTTAQITTQSSTFHPNQKIFVTFQVHTGNQLGAACLLWYWGNNAQTHFEFPLLGANGAAYSYMPVIALGVGKVEIYYASTTACTDKILAQSVNFTVNAA